MSSCVSPPSFAFDHKKPNVQDEQQKNIGQKNFWRIPRVTIDMKVRNRPQKRRGEKIIGVGKNIHSHMQTPGCHFPQWPFANNPHQQKN